MNKMKILFLASNPINTSRIRLDEESREIFNELSKSKERDRLEFAQRWAVNTNILQQSILDEEPSILHFSGHGHEVGIALEDINGSSKLISAEALEDLFDLFSSQIKCVILNSCFSIFQAKAIVSKIPYVIGMSDAMPDKAAILFAIGFYKGIGAGKDIEFSFKLGVNSIKLEGIKGSLLPTLLTKESKEFNDYDSKKTKNEIDLKFTTQIRNLLESEEIQKCALIIRNEPLWNYTKDSNLLKIQRDISEHLDSGVINQQVLRNLIKAFHSKLTK